MSLMGKRWLRNRLDIVIGRFSSRGSWVVSKLAGNLTGTTSNPSLVTGAPFGNPKLENHQVKQKDTGLLAACRPKNQPFRTPCLRMRLVVWEARAAVPPRHWPYSQEGETSNYG